jgi:hypothetical protein
MKLYILLLLLLFFNYSESFFYILPLFNKIFNKKYNLDKICSNIVGSKKYNTTLKNRYISRYDLDRISSNIVGPKKNNTTLKNRYISRYDLDRISSNIVGPKKNNTTLKKIDYNIIERSNRTYF